MIRKYYCFIQITWALAQLFKTNHKYTSTNSIHDWAAEGEFLDLCLKSVQENSVYKESCVLKEKQKPKLN